MTNTSMGVVFCRACPGGRWPASPATHFGTPPREHKHYDSRGFGSSRTLALGCVTCVRLKCGRCFCGIVVRTRVWRTLGGGPRDSRNLDNHSVCARGVVSQSESSDSLAADLPDKPCQTLRTSMFWQSGGRHFL